MSKRPETGARLFIGGFPRYTDKSELEEFCSRFGKVKHTDLVPTRQVAFVTFTSKEEATLAMFGIQQQVFKGTHLRVDWAKVRQNDKKEPKAESTAPGALKADSQPGAKDPAKDVVPAKERYIPGDMKESVVKTVIENIQVQVTEDVPVSSVNVPEEPEPVKLQPIPNLINRPNYSESSPPLEITIRDTQSHDIKYSFRISSLNKLKHYLIEESNSEVSAQDLFYASSLKNDKNILYGGVPVVHVYEDLLGKEMLEPRENKEKRENFLRNKRQSKTIPKAETPLSSKNIPVEEAYHLLASKGYDYVLLNTSPNGPTAPLHPSWKPVPNSYTFRKGAVLVTFSGKTHVDSFQFLNQSSNQSYKDLLPILVKYDVCIFNSNKGAFITPEQLQ